MVDNGRRAINKTIDITVTSVHQTTAGKMIFGRYDDRNETARAGAATESASRASADLQANDRLPRSIIPDPSQS